MPLGPPASAACLNRLETDAVKTPSPHVLHQLSEALNVPYNDLLHLSGYPLPHEPDRNVARTIGSALFADLPDEEREELLEYVAWYRAATFKPWHRYAELSMHASTRILLLLVAAVAIVAGWWILLAINSAVIGIIYSVAWTVIVLILARVLSALGFGYKRFTARRGRDRPSGSPDAATALAELSDLRERGLISPDEYDAKRAKIVERL